MSNWNTFISALGITPYDVGELSDKYPLWITPAGFTFAIWGVIYLWLAVMVVFCEYFDCEQ